MRADAELRQLAPPYARVSIDCAVAPACVSLSILLLVAVFAFQAPVTTKILAVTLLAGPHNLVEFKHFLSRLPVRWTGGMRTFFILSISGLLLLTVSYVVLMTAIYSGLIAWSPASGLYGIWGALLSIWAGLLVLMGYRCSHRFVAMPVSFLSSAIGLTALAALFAFFQPVYFGISLVYLHPVISLLILDRELARSRPTWLFGYRLALAAVPCTIAMFWFHLHDVSLILQNPSANQVVEQTGATVMTFASNHFFLSSLVLLDLLHYAVWLIAIPNWALGWNRWSLTARPPVATRFPSLERPLQISFMLVSFVVVCLWLCFSTNYVATSQAYFVLAIAHVLAEVPYLAWINR